jgi:hypothetical protein
MPLLLLIILLTAPCEQVVRDWFPLGSVTLQPATQMCNLLATTLWNLQFMNVMAEDPKTFKLAEEGVRNSPIYDVLEKRILKGADLENKYVSKAHQVSLFRLGHYSERRWKLLRDSLKEHVNLASPTTIRTVCHCLWADSLWVPGNVHYRPVLMVIVPWYLES